MITKDIAAKIKAYDKIIILRHINPDGDAYGVQFGLKHLILENFPQKQVLLGGESLEDLNYIGRCDVLDSRDYQNSLVIIGDCANKQRIDSAYWNQAAYVIKIDHHPAFQGSDYADMEWVDDTCPAASEMIAQLALDNKWTINCEAARALFHGIVTDTGRFLHANLRPQTFIVAASLLATKFNYRELYAEMYTRTAHTIAFEKYILNNFQVSANGLAYLKNLPPTLKKFHLSQDKANSFVNSLGNISGVSIWLFASQNQDDAFIKISVRSAKIKINDLASKFGGGGHNLAAGIKVKSWREVDDIIAAFDAMLEKNYKNEI